MSQNFLAHHHDRTPPEREKRNNELTRRTPTKMRKTIINIQ